MFNKNIISIDIGSKNIKIIVGNYKSNNVYVENALTLNTPNDAYKNGYIIDGEILREVIKDALVKENIKVKKVICTVKSTAIITREIIIPFVEDEDIAPMARIEIEQFLPIMLDDFVIEYRVLQEFEEDNKKKLRVIVAALPKEIANDYLKLLHNLDLIPIALDMNANAILKLFSNPCKINNENYSLEKTVSIIDLGHNYIDVNIISKGIMEFSRIIPMGSGDIDMSIASLLNLTINEAEMKKINKIDLLVENEDDSFEINIINDNVKMNIEYWIQEIRRVYQYYINRDRENKVEEIYIYGGASKLTGLEGYLNSVLDTLCIKIDKMNNVQISKKIEDLNITSYLNCIGALMRK